MRRPFRHSTNLRCQHTEKPHCNQEQPLLKGADRFFSRHQRCLEGSWEGNDTADTCNELDEIGEHHDPMHPVHTGLPPRMPRNSRNGMLFPGNIVLSISVTMEALRPKKDLILGGCNRIRRDLGGKLIADSSRDNICPRVVART